MTRRRDLAASGGPPAGYMGGGNNESQLASPIEKYFTMKDDYLRNGKGWEWEKMRDVVVAQYEAKGWDDSIWMMAQLRQLTDHDVPIDPERRGIVRKDDDELKAQLAEIRANAEKARREAQGAEASNMQASTDILALQKQVADLIEMNKNLMAMQAAPPQAPVAAGPVINMPDVPSLSMTKGQMLAYASAHGITLTPFLRGANGTKHDTLEAILEELDARKAAEAAKAGEQPEE